MQWPAAALRVSSRAMNPKTTVHLVQLDCVWEDKRANFERVRQLLEETSPAPGALIVLPEMFATGFSFQTSITAEPSGGETELFLREIARQWGCGVIGGLVHRDGRGACQNQALVVDDSGKTTARYSKIHPFTLGGEDRCHTAGTDLVLAAWGGWSLAPLVCYDLRFPELAREAVFLGAEVLVYIASWPAKRWHHWLSLLQARAIENLADVIGVNRCGADPDFSYQGRSVVVDPHGAIIADAGSHEHVIPAVMERRVLTSWRSEFPALKDARRLG